MKKPKLENFVKKEKPVSDDDEDEDVSMEDDDDWKPEIPVESNSLSISKKSAKDKSYKKVRRWLFTWLFDRLSKIVI